MTNDGGVTAASGTTVLNGSMTGNLTVAAGAHADLIVVDGDPLKDLSLLTRQGRHMPVIMKGGAFMKRASLN